MRIDQVILPIFVIVLINTYVLANDKVIEVGKQFVSPDGRFTVHLDTNDHEYRFAIHDNETGQSDNSIVMPTILHALKWTGDSETIATVEHLAGGSLAGIIRFKNNHWVQSDIEPPESGRGSYEIIKWKVGEKFINLTYKVAHEKENGEKTGFSLCSFDLSPETGNISNVKILSLKEDAYRAVKSDF